MRWKSSFRILSNENRDRLFLLDSKRIGVCKLGYQYFRMSHSITDLIIDVAFRRSCVSNTEIKDHVSSLNECAHFFFFFFLIHQTKTEKQ